MFKLPYEQLSVEVEKLYSKPFEESNTKGILDHCEFIRNFIEACGWSVDEYIERMWAGVKN